jgi:hypothetical protein
VVPVEPVMRTDPNVGEGGLPLSARLCDLPFGAASACRACALSAWNGRDGQSSATVAGCRRAIIGALGGHDPRGWRRWLTGRRGLGTLALAGGHIAPWLIDGATLRRVYPWLRIARAAGGLEPLSIP